MAISDQVTNGLEWQGAVSLIGIIGDSLAVVIDYAVFRLLAVTGVNVIRPRKQFIINLEFS